MFDRIFGKGKKKESPEVMTIQFGRYSDNNKPQAKSDRWTDAEKLYKEKKHTECLDAFFDYLRDDGTQNVVYERNGDRGQFHFYQGSKIVQGRFDRETVRAEVTLARMPEPNVPVMRRLLEMNFNLFYSRFALDQDRLCMQFDSDLHSASPGKLYYGLKELATRADKQDDLLIQDFSVLQEAETNHLMKIPEKEKEIKWKSLQKWIDETTEQVKSLDAEKMAGGIAYLWLSLIYRIDYLAAPEGSLLYELEKIGTIYFNKDERTAAAKNHEMAAAFRKLRDWPAEKACSCFVRSRHTFSIVAPKPYKTIAEAIIESRQNMIWYRDNQFPAVARQIALYGISYCQYSYSLPRVITDLYHLLMKANYPEYFRELGFEQMLYNEKTNRFQEKMIIAEIREIQERWNKKYPRLNFDTQAVRFTNLIDFNDSFTAQLEILNMET